MLLLVARADRLRDVDRRRLPKEGAVDRFRLGRRVRTELVGEQTAATLVDAQRLRAVSRGRVGFHEPAVATLAKRLERGQLFRIPDRLARVPGCE